MQEALQKSYGTTGEKNFEKITNRENSKTSLYKYPGKSILNVNRVFLVRPICPVSGIFFPEVPAKCLPRQHASKASMVIRPAHKNLFLEFPKNPGSFMLHFDRCFAQISLLH